MKNSNAHWDRIFKSKKDADLGWYESSASQTLKFIESIDMPATATIFLSGAGTSNLVDALLDSGFELVINDISNEALKQIKHRLGFSSSEYLHYDMAMPLTKNYTVDCWVDRAVLHFLLSENEINNYFDNLKACVKVGGYVLLAEFANEGAKKCAGLEVHQYTVDEMQQRLGGEFTLIREEVYSFTNPFGDEKPYVYALFRRKQA